MMVSVTCWIISLFKASGINLEALGEGGHAEFVGDGFAVPFHEGGVDFEDFMAVGADDLGLEGLGAFLGHVVFVVAADVDFADESAFDEEGEGAVDGGAGDGGIEEFGVGEEVFCGEM